LHEIEFPGVIVWLLDCVIVEGHAPVGGAADAGSTSAQA
jgi:hypothetical protein